MADAVNAVSQPFLGGANRAAGAAQNAALAQQAEAQKNYRNVEGIINPASVSALASYDKILANQDRTLTRSEDLMKSIDPTLLEASTQALKLLRGESAPVLDPLKAQRNQQRQQLLNTLREQLGPGAETSSAGQKALQQFDLQSSSLFSNAQQSYLGQLGSTANQFNVVRQGVNNDVMNFGNLATGRFNIAQGQASTLNQAANPLIQTAGAEYTGEQLRGTAQQGFMNSLIGAGAQIGGMYAMGGAKGA